VMEGLHRLPNASRRLSVVGPRRLHVAGSLIDPRDSAIRDWASDNILQQPQTASMCSPAGNSLENPNSMMTV
jgi:hypothetical protein